jgi:hypothetical protein
VQIFLTRKAEADLETLQNFPIEKIRPITVEGVMEDLEILGIFPGEGVSGSIPRTRELIMPDYPFSAIYTVVEGSVLVYRILPNV